MASQPKVMDIHGHPHSMSISSMPNERCISNLEYRKHTSQSSGQCCPQLTLFVGYGLWHKFAQLRGMPQLRHAMPTLGPSWPLARKTKFEVGPGDPRFVLRSRGDHVAPEARFASVLPLNPFHVLPRSL